MYKEQEILKMKNHKDIKAAYNLHCSKLSTYDAVFFPARVSLLRVHVAREEKTSKISDITFWEEGEGGCITSEWMLHVSSRGLWIRFVGHTYLDIYL